MNKFKIIKVISGGQTGADQAGLAAAKKLNITTGGTAPKGYKTELGSNNELKTIYGLIQSHSEDYALRTESNIRSSHATLIFSNKTSSPGTKLTIKLCIKNKKKYAIIDPFSSTAKEVAATFVSDVFKSFNRDIILNIAGNRGSKSPGIQQQVEMLLVELFSEINN
jgi:hypothetical protein